ncbi:D-2-hydroxyacid dehydrogenase [Moraxella nasovis]|uniref:NAD(P)-dependent oxidoreductase n=1 Tax=Moraxella nasovis TaxID=2904121 RepID=UPI001F615CBB|nr:NAD(P)-dependent oxidoreductase [Moraxella nasovis]UNU73987.1 D-2-hydroxyacid dehydrogenase [Moraxella nasovis]
MKAVFLDAATFSSQVDLSLPKCITDYERYDSTKTDQIIDRCYDADIIITNKVVITADIISKLPKLKLIHVTATGVNNIDVKACDECGITVKNVAGYSVKSVPEHTFMLLLNIMRAARHYHQKATDGTWQADGRFCLLDEPIFDLSGKTIGIIGSGNIGRQVGKIAAAFGMTVLFAERRGRVPRSKEYSDFYTVLQTADVLSLHCPLTDDTYHLISNDTLEQMHKKPVIINVARGDIVDSHAIVHAITTGQITGYATDVFPHEPFNDDEPLLNLKDHPRVFFTPHNAWGSLNAQRTLWGILCRQIDEFISHV